MNLHLFKNYNTKIKPCKQGLCPVGGDCYHTIFNALFKTKFGFFFLPYVGAMAIAPYGFSDMKSLSERFYFMLTFFNVALANSTLQAFFKEKH